jgi:hypothetical protein
MAYSDEIEISPEEMGIDAQTFEERFDELALFIENHAEAIKQYLEMMNWGGNYTVGSTKHGAVATWAGEA